MADDRGARIRFGRPPVGGESSNGNGGGSPTFVTVHVAPKTVFLVCAIIATVWLSFKLTDFLLVVFFAILLATAIDQPVSWMARHKVPRPAGVAVMFAILVGMIAIVVLALIPLVGAESVRLQDKWPEYRHQLEDLLNRYNKNNTGAGTSQISLDKLSTQLSAHFSDLAARATTVAIGIGHMLVLLFAMFVLAFFLASDPGLGPRMLVRFAPTAWHSRALSAGASVRLRIGAWARGQLVIALSFGTMLGLSAWALGIPYAASIAVIGAVLEIVPYVGGAITIIVTGLVALSVGIPQLIGIIIIYTILVNIESHVLAPVLFGRVVGLPSVAILLALLAGVELLGVVGALLAVPATVIIWAIVEELWPSPTVRERRRIRWLPNLEPKNPSEAAPPATPPATTAHR
jgi:predicted PurR-regulated permease PerM